MPVILFMPVPSPVKPSSSASDGRFFELPPTSPQHRLIPGMLLLVLFSDAYTLAHHSSTLFGFRPFPSHPLHARIIFFSNHISEVTGYIPSYDRCPQPSTLCVVLFPPCFFEDAFTPPFLKEFSRDLVAFRPPP